MSDMDDQPFVKPRADRKKEKRKKERKTRSCTDNSEDDAELSSVSAMETEASTRKRIRPPTTTDDGDSTDCSIIKSCRPVKQERVSPAPSIAASPVIPQPPKPAPSKPALAKSAKSAPTTATTAQLVHQAAHLASGILNFCLHEANKIGKTQTTSIMERVADLTRIVSDLALENNFLRGALEHSAPAPAHPLANPPQKRDPRATTTATPSTPAVSSASVTGRNPSAPSAPPTPRRTVGYFADLAG